VSEILKSITEGQILDILDNILPIIAGKLKDLNREPKFKKYM